MRGAGASEQALPAPRAAGRVWETGGRVGPGRGPPPPDIRLHAGSVREKTAWQSERVQTRGRAGALHALVG